MATLYKCDRCGKEETNINKIAPIQIPDVSRLATRIDNVREIFRITRDLCLDCCLMLREYVNKMREP